MVRYMVKILRMQRSISWESKTRHLSAGTSHKNGSWKQDRQWAPRRCPSVSSLSRSPLLFLRICSIFLLAPLFLLVSSLPWPIAAPVQLMPLNPSAPALLRSLQPVDLDFPERYDRQNSCFGARLQALVSCPAYDLSALVLGVQPKPIREWKEVAGHVLEHIHMYMESCVAHLRTVMPQEWEAHQNCAVLVLPPQVSRKLPRPGGVPTPR